MTAIERQRRILKALCSRGHDTRENLALEFGVSERTIERDVITLSLSYPIYTVQGNGGGIYIDNEYKPKRERLSNEQEQLLIRLLQTLNGKDAEIMTDILKTFGNTRRTKNDN